MEPQVYFEHQTPETYTIGLLLQALQKAVEDANRRMKRDEAAVLANLRVIIESHAGAEKTHIQSLLQGLAWDSYWPDDVIGGIYRDVCGHQRVSRFAWLSRWREMFPEPRGLELLLCSWPRSPDASDAIASQLGIKSGKVWNFVSEYQALAGRFRS